jgi:hypothetical protein
MALFESRKLTHSEQVGRLMKRLENLLGSKAGYPLKIVAMLALHKGQVDLLMPGFLTRAEVKKLLREILDSPEE